MSKKLIDEILSPNRDYKPRTPPGVMEQFIDGSIHTDFLNEIKVRIEGMRDFNEECSSKEYLETRGGIKALRLVSGIFVDLFENVKRDNKPKEEKRDVIR